MSLIVALNRLANLLAGWLLAPLAWLPGWLSATLIGAVTGVAMLLVFKHTSNQPAIKATRNQIKANLLALSLFRDSIAVGIRAQGRLLAYAARLLFLSLVPMAVMTLPMLVLLGQLGLWYQARPLHVDEQALLTVDLRPGHGEALPTVTLESTPAVRIVAGPVRIAVRDRVCWKVAATTEGLQELTVRVNDEAFTKQLAVGDGYMPVSQKRPERNLSEVLLHPREAPFDESSILRSIEVAFPERESWIAGTDHWLLYWFAISMVAALVCKPWLNVSL